MRAVATYDAAHHLMLRMTPHLPDRKVLPYLPAHIHALGYRHVGSKLGYLARSGLTSLRSIQFRVYLANCCPKIAIEGCYHINTTLAVAKSFHMIVRSHDASDPTGSALKVRDVQQCI